MADKKVKIVLLSAIKADNNCGGTFILILYLGANEDE
jgi:hypothetical protein